MGSCAHENQWAWQKKMKADARQYISSARPGFTMVELLIAVVLIAIGCMAVMSMLATSMTSNTAAVQENRAAVLAESQMEMLRSLDFNAVPTMDATEDKFAFDLVSDCQTQPPCMFKRTTTITSGHPTSRSHEISIRVEWDWATPGGKARSLVYDGIISDYSF